MSQSNMSYAWITMIHLAINNITLIIMSRDRSSELVSSRKLFANDRDAYLELCLHGINDFAEESMNLAGYRSENNFVRTIKIIM